MRRDKIHCHKPLLKWEFGIVEDCTYETRETLLAIGTFELIVTIGAYVSMGTSTERTNHVATPTLLSDKITATLVRIEVIDE